MAALLGYKSSTTSTSRHSLKKSVNSDLLSHHQWCDQVSSKNCTTDDSGKLTILPILEAEYSIPADATSTAGICSPKLPSCLHSPIDSTAKSTKSAFAVSAHNNTPTCSSALKIPHSPSEQFVNQSDYSEPVSASRRHRSDSEPSINVTKTYLSRGSMSSTPKLGLLASGCLSGNLRHHPQSAFEAVPKRKSPSRIATNPELESFLHLTSLPTASVADVVTHQHVEQGTYEEAWDIKLPRSHLHMVLGQKVRGLTAPVAQLEDLHLNSADDDDEDGDCGAGNDEEQDDDVLVAVSSPANIAAANSAISTAPSFVYDYAYGKAWEMSKNINYQHSHSESCAAAERTSINNSSALIKSTTQLQHQPPPVISTQHSLPHELRCDETNSKSHCRGSAAAPANQYDDPWDIRRQQAIDEIKNGIKKSLPMTTPPTPSQIQHHQKSASCLAPSTASAVELFQPKKERQRSERSPVGLSSSERRPRHSIGSVVTGGNWTVGESLESQPWYHGFITRCEAEQSLARHRTGSFLVRRCESNPDDFSLSIKGDKSFLHMKIIRNSARHYVLGQYSQPYSSIPEMIHHYSVFHLPIKGADQIILINPVAAIESSVFD